MPVAPRMSAGKVSAHTAARQVAERSADVRAAVLLDAAGSLLGSSGADPKGARQLGELGRRLVEQADAVSAEPVEQIEVQMTEGGVFAVRTPRYVLACVTRRLALPALVLYDLRQTMLELEAAT